MPKHGFGGIVSSDWPRLHEFTFLPDTFRGYVIGLRSSKLNPKTNFPTSQDLAVQAERGKRQLAEAAAMQKVKAAQAAAIQKRVLLNVGRIEDYALGHVLRWAKSRALKVEGISDAELNELKQRGFSIKPLEIFSPEEVFEIFFQAFNCEDLAQGFEDVLVDCFEDLTLSFEKLLEKIQLRLASFVRNIDEIDDEEESAEDHQDRVAHQIIKLLEVERLRAIAKSRMSQIFIDLKIPCSTRSPERLCYQVAWPTKQTPDFQNDQIHAAELKYLQDSGLVDFENLGDVLSQLSKEFGLRMAVISFKPNETAPWVLTLDGPLKIKMQFLGPYSTSKIFRALGYEANVISNRQRLILKVRW